MQFDTNGKKPLTEGGEGIIYDNNSTVIKIYKPHVNLQSKQKRIKALINATLPKEVVKPVDIVTDRKGKFIGMVMPKVSGEDFKRLSNKKFVTSNNINTKDILIMLSRFWDVLNELHRQSIYIGDLNDQNILFDVKTKQIYLIDTDSWSIGTEKCEVAMDLFKDPKLVANNFNADTDIYSFCVLAWKSLTRVHPFGGTTNPDMQILERIQKGISVIDNPDVKIPRTTKTWKNLSPDLIADFKKVFNSGDRKFGNSIEEMLKNLAFCKNDNDYYFAEFSSCPMCNANATVVRKATSIGVAIGFKIAQMLNSSNIKTVYSERAYLNTSDEVVDIKTGKKVKYPGARCLFDDDGNIVVCYKDKMVLDIGGKETAINIQYNSYPIMDGNDLYYISENGRFCKAQILNGGIGKKVIQNCSINSFYKVKNGKYCIVNIYDENIVVCIDGYYHTLNFNKKIVSGDVHYDKHLDRWLLLIEDSANAYHSYIFEKNTLLWQNSKITYKCPVYNVAFDYGTIYIPVDEAIRGLNVKTLNYKDFQCDVVSPDSMLIKNNSQFVIVNDDNIYRFYK